MASFPKSCVRQLMWVPTARTPASPVVRLDYEGTPMAYPSSSDQPLPGGVDPVPYPAGAPLGPPPPTRGWVVDVALGT